MHRPAGTPGRPGGRCNSPTPHPGRTNGPDSPKHPRTGFRRGRHRPESVRSHPERRATGADRGHHHPDEDGGKGKLHEDSGAQVSECRSCSGNYVGAGGPATSGEATTAPVNWATQYPIESLNEIRLSRSIARVTAGLQWALETCPRVQIPARSASPKANEIAIISAAPVAPRLRGFPSCLRRRGSGSP